MEIRITCQNIPGYTPEEVVWELRNFITEAMVMKNTDNAGVVFDFENNLKITVEP